MIRAFSTTAALLLLTATVSSQDKPTLPPLDPGAAAKISYRKDVAPILKRHCISCHTKNEAEADLNMDTVKLFIRGGKKGPAIVAGKPDDSLAIQMVTGVKKPAMPHKQAPLPPAKIQTLRLWVLGGAKDDSEPSTVVAKVVIPKTYKIAPAIASVAFSPDGKQLAAACRSEVVVVTLEGEAEPQRLPTESDLVTYVGFSPDGQMLVSAGGSPAQYGEVRFFEMADGIWKLRNARRIGKDTLFRGGFSPDGKTLALGGTDGAIYLVPTGDGEVAKHDLHSDWVSAVTFSADGRFLFSASRDRTIKATLFETGKLIRSLGTLGDYANAVAASPTVAIGGGRDKVPAVYDLKAALGDVFVKNDPNASAPTQPAAQYTRKLEGQSGEILDLDTDAKRTKLAVAGTGIEVRVYSLPDGKRLANLTNVPAPVYAVALSADGVRVATGSQSGQLGIYDAATGKLIKQLVPVPVE
jgi:WD40 repeat protein